MKQHRHTGRRILLIEDDEDASLVLCSLLTADGHTVTTAFNGIVGLGLARTQHFDILLCDIGLPGIDGLELISRLRAASDVHIPFAIAISGAAHSAERELAIGAGFGHYFVKPFDVQQLLALIASDAVSRCIARPGT